MSLRANRAVPGQPEAGGDRRRASLALRPEEELQPTKTRGFNDSISQDGVSRPFLGVLLERIARQENF